MTRASIVKGLMASAALLLSVCQAEATTLTFDGLGNFAPIANGYGGFNWSNFSTLDAVNYFANNGTNGYTNGMVSQTGVAYNAFANPASFSSSSNFTLNSFYLTAAWNNGLNVVVQGFDDGNLVHTASLVVSSLGPVLITLNWLDVDSVLFTSSGGVNAGYNGSGTHFAMDNVTVNNPVSAVPVPAALPLLVSGLVGIAALGRRKRRKTITT